MSRRLSMKASRNVTDLGGAGYRRKIVDDHMRQQLPEMKPATVADVNPRDKGSKCNASCHHEDGGGTRLCWG